MSRTQIFPILWLSLWKVAGQILTENQFDHWRFAVGNDGDSKDRFHHGLFAIVDIVPDLKRGEFIQQIHETKLQIKAELEMLENDATSD